MQKGDGVAPWTVGCLSSSRTGTRQDPSAQFSLGFQERLFPFLPQGKASLVAHFMVFT